MQKNVLLKLAVFGEGGVGKTSLVNAFLGKEVPSDYSPTFNSKVSKKDYVLKKAGVVLKINIWDVGGNRAINPIVNKAFFTDVDLALIVFDLTKPGETLKNYKKNFLNEINRYSEEPLTLIVGNKLDKFSLNKDFKEKIINVLGENSRFSVISATSAINVNNCFHLLINTFLKKAEILLPDLVPENSSIEFIELLGINEQELRNQLVNLATIESRYRDLKSQIKTSNDIIPKETKEEKYYEFIQKELQKILNQKRSIRDNFFSNITSLEKKINQMKKRSNKSVTEVIDELKNSLENSKRTCEEDTEKLLSLNREENELTIISLKAEKDTDKLPEEAKSPLPEIIEVNGKTITEVEASPPKVIEVYEGKNTEVELSPPKVIEVNGETTAEIKDPLSKPKYETIEPEIIRSMVKQVSIDPISRERVVPLTNKEDKIVSPPKAKEAPKKLKVELIPSVKSISEKPKEIEIKPTLKKKADVSKVKEDKVVSPPKAKVVLKKIKEVKIASKPIKKDPKIEFYNKFEKENPGKRAVYRGKETKGFLVWKEQNSKK